MGEHTVDEFISRWRAAGGGERSNYQLFLNELCDLLDAPKPQPAVAVESQNAYVFERKIPARRIDGPTTANFIDLYKRGCFVLEAKQSAKRLRQFEELKQFGLDLPGLRVGSGKRGGAQWDTIMRNAREQAETYAKRLPPEEGWPPFLVIVDVGHVIELYADFSLQGKHYAQFPDRQSFRIYLEDLRREDVRERLRLVWTDPGLLNPARRTSEVTREIAELLAKLSKSLETRLLRALPSDLALESHVAEHHAIAERVALFLMRCLFTMFAEDVELLERDSFTGLLRQYRNTANRLHIALTQLWEQMNTGGFSPILRSDVLHFNGSLFKAAEALEINEDELGWLIIAAQRDWKDVEPAIFGTLLERALSARERHQLGAHYTPRAYVERLVVATIIEPLTEDWRNVQAAAVQKIESGDQESARKEIRDFHRDLCAVRVLDPACGTGNFLYVAMELMKRLEGEVLETLTDLGDDQYILELDRHTVDPHQFLGLEFNPRAVAIAELVLWIGYLQWHFRTRGRTMPAQPVLKNFANIVEQDAVLQSDSWDVLRDETGRPITRWDGITYKLHPITGEEVPDEAAKVELRTYLNPRPATWPKADFIVGNPPFIGNKRMIEELGEGYSNATRQAYSEVPRSVDYVMYWWHLAALRVRSGEVRRFGLITTNSLTQAFNRKVAELHLSAQTEQLSLIFAIPDHPWLKASDKAAVRVSMTVGVAGNRPGVLFHVVSEKGLNSDAPDIELIGRRGLIGSSLSVGPDLLSTQQLRSNEGLSFQGCKLVGADFQITPQMREEFIRRDPALTSRLPRYWAGRDITKKHKVRFVIDFFGLAQAEAAKFKQPYQWILDRVKPQRDQVRRKGHRERWWIFGEPRPGLRAALASIDRYIATSEVSKHRFFWFLRWPEDLIDGSVIAIAHDDYWVFGVLSCRFHQCWAVHAGGRMGAGNDPRYQNEIVFDPFPFPDPPEDLKARIRDLGERLDAHRKTVLERHTQLTMTKLYNVLEKVRAEEALTDAERDVYEAGLVGVLRLIHDELDAAVAEAYGWPEDLSDEEILERLVALNHERAAEERKGNVRWLRPDFQAPKEAPKEKKAEQLEADLLVANDKRKKPRLPSALPEQVAEIRAALADADAPLSAADLARQFSQGRRVERKVGDVLRALAMLGQAEQVDGGYVLSQ